jgi:hypothetical protein
MTLVEPMDPKTDRVISIDFCVQSAYTMFIYAKYKSTTATFMIVLVSSVKIYIKMYVSSVILRNIFLTDIWVIKLHLLL